MSFDIQKSPVLPGLFALPCKLIPISVHSQLLVFFLNRLLKEQMLEGDLSFLESRRLCVNVRDANIKYFISLKNNELVSIAPSSKNDIEIKASVFDFLQLAARQQDPDTLVFQRRLVMQGNTELGLEIKNFLDGLDLESSEMFSKVEKMLELVLGGIKKIYH